MAEDTTNSVDSLPTQENLKCSWISGKNKALLAVNYTYIAIKINAVVCTIITPSPACFIVFMHLAQNQFS